MKSQDFWVKSNQEGDLTIYPSDETLKTLTEMYKGKTVSVERFDVLDFFVDNVIRRTEDDQSFSYLALKHEKDTKRLLLTIRNWHGVKVQ